MRRLVIYEIINILILPVIYNILLVLFAPDDYRIQRDPTEQNLNPFVDVIAISNENILRFLLQAIMVVILF